MLRRLAAAAAFLCCTIALPLSAGISKDQDFRPATAEELAMKSLATAPGVPAAVLDWVHYDDHVAGSMSEYLRIKVFSEGGKKYGDVEVPYFAAYPFLGYVTDIQARTIHPDGTILPFDGRVYDKLLFKKNGRTYRAKTFSLPDVQPGSILEYHYVVRWSEMVIVDAEWLIQKDIPVEHAKFSLLPFSRKYADYATFFTYAALPAGKKPVKVTTDRWELELEHIPAWREEAFALPEEQLKPHVNFYYTTSRIRPEQFWDVQSHTWAKEINSFVGDSRSLAATAQGVAGAEGEGAAKLRKLYAHVQSFANRSVNAAPAALSDQKAARNAEQVLTARAGTSTDLARTFVALARGAGFDADVVRIAPRDSIFFSDKVPDAQQMSGEVAMVMDGATPIFLDPGTPGAPFGVVSWEKSAVPAIRMAKSGPQWIKVPGYPPSGAMLQRNADLHLDGDLLTGTITVRFQGQEALVRRQKGDDEKSRRTAIEKEIQSWFPNGATLKVNSIEGLSTPDDAIVVKADAQLPGVVSPAGSRLMMPISLFAASAANPFAPATRESAIYFPYGRQENDEVKLTLPEKVAAVTIPGPQSIDVGSFAFKSATMQDGNVLTFHRSFTVDAMFIDAEHYAAVRNVFSTVTTADQRPLVLRAAGPD
jgi:hypothetical protein